MYKERFENAELKKGKGYALREAFRIWCQLFGRPRRYRIIRDEVGKVAYEMGSIILAAKHSQDGDVVSCHKFLWDVCLKEKRILVIYIKDSGYFYRFSPAEIKESAINERGGQEMVNFSIKEGRNLMRVKAEKAKIKNTVEKNREYTLKELAQMGVF